ncbi:MAG: CcdB family protein [Pseudomonadota bacterium]
MARFDVYRTFMPHVPLILDVQSRLLGHLTTRVGIPLYPWSAARQEGLPRLKPRIMVSEAAYLLSTTEIAALPVSDLGAFVENIEARHGDDILAALDFLFSGF